MSGAGQGGTKAGGESSARTTLIAFVEGGLYVGCAVGSTIFGQLGQFVRTGCSHLIYFAVGSSLYGVDFFPQPSGILTQPFALDIGI